MGDANPSVGRRFGLLRKAVRHPAIVLAVLVVGVGLSVLSSAVIRGWERQMAAQKAADVVREQAENLHVKVLRSMEVLYSVASLYQAQGQLDRRQFHNFVQQALARQPELRALSWNPCVPADHRRELESAAIADGIAGFQFQELNSTGQLVVAGDRPEYVPVYFIEPLDRNLPALGFDLGTDANRRSSLEQARDSGKPVATAPVHLAQEPDHNAGLLVLLPVYRGQAPKDSAGRREQLVGFAVAVFKIADLVGAAFRELNIKGIEARLLDQSAAHELIYGELPSANEPAASGQSAQAGVEIAGRRWTLEFEPTDRFTAAQPHEQSRLALLGGLAFTLLITAHLYNGWRRTKEIGAANAALQEEVAIRQRAEAAAAAANQAKSDFLASMSHEIRTPLNAILGYTQLMRHDPNLSADQRDAIGGISASGGHLLGLINEILDLAKIEAGRMELHPANFDVSALARGLRATFQPLCAQKRIGFRLETDSGTCGCVRGDESKLRQVLINLLGNAVKFTQAGEVYLRIKAIEQGRWLFEVIDTGLGIPEEEQADIFNPFHQGSSAAHQGGTGLGLAIARRQVELLGGTLELQSERGIGSRFYFRIPLPTVASSEVTEAPASLPRLKPGQRIRALVVDDSHVNREVLGGMLSLMGCEVCFASGGREALHTAREQKPDVVFMDLLMPGMDGMMASRALLSDPAGEGPKIVAHSAATLSLNREQAREAGCADFLAKPICAEQLQACLRVHLDAEFAPADPDHSPIETVQSWETGPVCLPEELYARLTTAAELHSTTALKACLVELRQLGPEAATLAEHIRHLMRSYDMDGILRLISRAASPAFSSTPVHHGFD